MAPSGRSPRRVACGAVVAVVLFACLGLALQGCDRAPAGPATEGPPFPQLTAEYHAVVLTSGQVYYARVRPEAGGFLRLDDVFYIVGQPPSGNEVAKGSLIRRGRELHGPTYTLVNRDQVLMIEPVARGSRVGELIREASR